MVLGGVLLVFGRRLFWLFVGMLGFMLGTQMATAVLSQPSDKEILATAIVAGVIGALLARFLQRLAFGLAGLYAGAVLSLHLTKALHADESTLLFCAVGAIIGCVLALVVVDWAMIVLASFVGAATIAGELPLPPQMQFPAFLLLAITGIALQGRQLQRTSAQRMQTR